MLVITLQITEHGLKSVIKFGFTESLIRWMLKHWLYLLSQICQLFLVNEAIAQGLAHQDKLILGLMQKWPFDILISVILPSDIMLESYIVGFELYDGEKWTLETGVHVC